MSTSTLAYSSIHKAEYENGTGREAESGQIRSKGRQKTPQNAVTSSFSSFPPARGLVLGLLFRPGFCCPKNPTLLWP